MEPPATGSHFVANYPPFTCWSPSATPEVERRLATPSQTETTLGMYVHLPFCRRRCNFCYFKVYTEANATQVESYVDALLAEWRLLRERPFLTARRPTFLYFGGGTPSYLSVRQLERLFRGLPGAEADEIAFEAEPGTLTLTKLQALRAAGVTRLSLGVENFSDAVLEAGGRAHREAEVDRAWSWARQADFPQINLDLIAGMVGETDANWERCLDRTIELGPDSVTIYQLEVPENTLMFAQGVRPVDWATRRRWAARGFERLEQAGYHRSSAYTAVRGAHSFGYRDHLWRGADMIGLGVASFSHYGGVHAQNARHLEEYLTAVSAGRLPLWRAYLMNSDERLIRELVLQLKLGAVQPEDFQRKFGVDLLQRFAEPLNRLAHAFEPGELRWKPEALPEVDHLLREFFLEAHR